MTEIDRPWVTRCVRIQLLSNASSLRKRKKQICFTLRPGSPFFMLFSDYYYFILFFILFFITFFFNSQKIFCVLFVCFLLNVFITFNSQR